MSLCVREKREAPSFLLFLSLSVFVDLTGPAYAWKPTGWIDPFVVYERWYANASASFVSCVASMAKTTIIISPYCVASLCLHPLSISPGQRKTPTPTPMHAMPNDTKK